MNGLIKITPDKKRAKSILSMVETNIEMINNLDFNLFPSQITREYYEVIRELMGIVLLLDGYKTYGDGAHMNIIEYIGCKKILSSYEISLIKKLRNLRNKISYDGFFIDKDFILNKQKDINKIITQLKKIIQNEL